METEQIAILDCGGQYTKVIDRRVRELSVQSEILPVGVRAAELAGYRGIILSGGPASVWHSDALDYDPEIFSLNVPILGICYGMQLINTHFGGSVVPGMKTEYGETAITVDSSCPLFDGLDPLQRVLMSHGDAVGRLASVLKIAATSGDVCAAIYSESLAVYGVQFHPEVDLTDNGRIMLDNFVKRICKLKGNYVMADRIQNSLSKIQQQVGNEKVLVLVSGGVDSTVSAALLLKALNPDNIYAIHVDHGLMRKDESDKICENLRRLGLKNLIRADVSDIFFNNTVENDGRTLGPLTKLIDPEEKRNLIGNLFIRVVRDVAESLNLDFDRTFWAQGTLRPDLIESGNPDVSSYAHKIKTHHNDVDLIRRAREKNLVIETNWDWHKDEVRQVARTLGIDESIADRQPFPGPGLALRLICNDTSAGISKEQQSHFQEVLGGLATDCQGEVLPIRTVGVQGDCRSYRFLSVIWDKGLETDWSRLYEIGTAIPNRTDYINRVAYVLNKTGIDQPLIAHALSINKDSIALLRELDYVVRQSLKGASTSQVLAVLVPIGARKQLSVAVRAFVTNDYMTGRPAHIGEEIPLEVMAELVSKIEEQFSEIDLVLYDITSKPPATVEWQ